MLIRRLKKNETIQIGDLRIEFLRITPDTMRLAISAPSNVDVLHYKSDGTPYDRGAPTRPEDDGDDEYVRVAQYTGG